MIVNQRKGDIVYINYILLRSSASLEHYKCYFPVTCLRFRFLVLSAY